MPPCCVRTARRRASVLRAEQKGGATAAGARGSAGRWGGSGGLPRMEQQADSVERLTGATQQAIARCSATSNTRCNATRQVSGHRMGQQLFDRVIKLFRIARVETAQVAPITP